MGRSARHERPAAALSSARILLVEDSFLILMELESALLDAGAEAVCCRTVGEALSTLDAQPVSAAVLDVQLDRETSESVAERLARQGIPFLFYTGQLDGAPLHGDWSNCRVISKPAPRETIVAAVVDLLERPCRVGKGGQDAGG
jgi:DNA-binding response OmpR family regulator